MVAVFLRLRLSQLAHSLQRPPVQLLGLAVLLAYAVAGTVFMLSELQELRTTADPRTASIVIVCGSILTLGYLLIPLFFGSDDPADPRACATIGMPATQVAGGLAASAVISFPAVLLAVLAGAQATGWMAVPDASAVAVAAAAIIFVTGVLGARVARSVSAFWLHGRRSRELILLLVVGALVAAAPALVGIAATDWSARASREHLAGIAGTLGQTPVGAAWAAPAIAARGDVAGAWLMLGYGALFCGVLWFLWVWLVARMLVTPERPEKAPRTVGLGWFSLVPPTPTGAIAARSLTYWARDGRYRLSLLVVPIIPILLVPPLLIAGVWWQNLALIPLPVMCLFLGWMIHNDISSDNTAIWLHLATETSGWADRIGRTVPPLLIGAPLILVGAPITARLYGVPEVLPSVIGVSICLLLAGLGMSSAVSVRYPYPTVRPGDSPFAQPQSTTSAPGQALSFFGTVLVTLPVFALAGAGLVYDESWHVSALFAGAVIGVGVYFLGVSVGARTFATKAPELLAFSLRN